MAISTHNLVELPVMDVQCNWEEVFRDPVGEKFWISCRVPGSKTIQDRISKPVKYVHNPPTEGDFIIKDYKQHSMTVECPDVGLTTTFVPPRRTFQLHDKKLLCGDISESGELGVCSSEDGRLWVWDPDDGETRRSLEGHVGDVYTCRFFPSGIVVLSGGADLQLKIWSAVDGSCPRTLVGHKRGITDTAIIDRGRNVISVSSDGIAKLWDCGSGSCIANLASTQCPINACDITSSAMMAEKNTTPPSSPECGTSDKILLLAGEDRTMRCIDIRNREEVFSYNHSEEAAVLSCAFVGEVQAVCGSEDGVVSILDLRNTREALCRFSCGRSGITSLIQVGNGRCLSAHADGSCLVWGMDVTRQRTVSKLTGPDLDRITSVTKAKGSVFTTCRDGHVRQYNMADFDV